MAPGGVGGPGGLRLRIAGGGWTSSALASPIRQDQGGESPRELGLKLLIERTRRLILHLANNKPLTPHSLFLAVIVKR